MNTRRITPRHLGAAAAVYSVFVAGWYLGQPLAPECRVDQATLDRLAEERETEAEPSFAPAPSPTGDPSPHDLPSLLPLRPTHGPFPSVRGDDAAIVVTFSADSVACTADTSERPRLRAWFESDWR